VGDCDLGDPPLEPLLDQENDRNEREGVRRIPPKSRQEPRIAEPKSDHRQECDRTARPVHYPMNGRDVPDLLTGLQDALNIAHDDVSPSWPSRVLYHACAKRKGVPFRRRPHLTVQASPPNTAGCSQRATVPRVPQEGHAINVTPAFSQRMRLG